MPLSARRIASSGALRCVHHDAAQQVARSPRRVRFASNLGGEPIAGGSPGQAKPASSIG